MPRLFNFVVGQGFVGRSDSPLYPIVVLGLNTAMRSQEIKTLRWSQVDLMHRTLLVGKSKTEAGSGRLILLNQSAVAVLTKWASRTPTANQEHFVFPACERRNVDPNRPITSMFAYAVCAFGYLYRDDPQLIERRLRRGWRQETVGEQKLIMKFITAIILIVFVLPGLDHRFGLSHTPLWLTTVAEALVLGGCLLIFWTLKSNSFAASTVRVESGPRVISTGPYGMVRHPMYLGAAIWLLFTPLALGSYFALPVFALLIPLIVFRLLNEEKVLRQELPGYAEYCLHTHFRLVPFLW